METEMVSIPVVSQKTLTWCPTSISLLEEAEKEVLDLIQIPFEALFVDIGSVVGGTENKIRTVIFNRNSPENPLVLIHGFGSAIGLWSKTFTQLASTRPVYAIDLLGFGRSSRPSFSTNAEEVELQIVKSVEEWRKKMNLDKFIIVGHSMGGFLSTSYALCYPHRVLHVILSDPWGFPECPIPTWVKGIMYLPEQLNPLWIVRVAGPLGPRLVWGARRELVNQLAGSTKGAKFKLARYLYHVNAQHPTGEAAFRAMSTAYGWAKNPMIHRFDRLQNGLPLTFIHGEFSWVPRHPEDILKEMRKDSYLDIQIIPGAGHEIYPEDMFNDILLKACNVVKKDDA